MRNGGRILAGVVLWGAFLGAHAEGATFHLRLENTTTTTTWTQGLLTLQPLIALGPVPQPASPYWPTYQYANHACVEGDATTGDAVLLATRWGLVLGEDAWVVPALAPGQSATVTIQAPTMATLSFIAKTNANGGFLRDVGFDDFVAMHVPGSPSNLAVPLYDGNGQPLPSLSFSLRGYDANSTDPANGNNDSTPTSCGSWESYLGGFIWFNYRNYQGMCPTNPAAECWVTTGNYSTGDTGDIAASTTPQPTSGFTVGWTYTAGGSYFTDGLAMGSLSTAGANPGNELVVVQEGSDYTGNGPYTGVGRVAVLRRTDGATISSFAPPGGDLMGIPLVENLSGGTTSTLEYVVGQPSEAGSLYARNSNSTSLWTSSPWGWAGFWNMGPSSGELRTNLTGTEVVAGDWNGNISVLQNSGIVRHSLNVFTTYSPPEAIAGHLAVGNVDGVSGNEVVVAGAGYGRVMAFKAPSTNGAALTQAYVSNVLPGGAYVSGSGPALGNLDADSRLEMVIAATGSRAIYAFDSASPVCERQWTLTSGADYFWSSPVIGDVDGDGTKEIVVLSNDSVVSILSMAPAATQPVGRWCTEGTIEWEHTVGTGAGSWFTPALGNLVAGGGLEIVVADYGTLEVLTITTDGPQVAYRFSAPNAAFYPSAIIEPGTGGSSPAAHIYVSGWYDGRVYRLDTATGNQGGVIPVGWLTFMGDNQRTGAR